MFNEEILIYIFNANSIGPDQIPHSVASDLDQHCQRSQSSFHGKVEINRNYPAII